MLEDVKCDEKRKEQSKGDQKCRRGGYSVQSPQWEDGDIFSPEFHVKFCQCYAGV